MICGLWSLVFGLGSDVGKVKKVSKTQKLRPKAKGRRPKTQDRMPGSPISLPLIVAHRGMSLHAPENTGAAIRMALDVGAEGVEFDVRLTRDRVPVVIHDETLVRTARIKKRVADLTVGELRKVDVGSWFNSKYPKRARPEFGRETVPSLRRTLEMLERFDGLIYIELKCTETDYRDLCKAVSEVIREHPLLPQIVVKSFKLAAVPELRHLLPTVKTAALFAPEILHFLRRREHIVTLAREFGSHQLSVHHTLITRRLCALSADDAMPLTVWTVDDPNWLLRRRSFPISALITNDPQPFLNLKRRFELG